MRKGAEVKGRLIDVVPLPEVRVKYAFLRGGQYLCVLVNGTVRLDLLFKQASTVPAEC
jgi:hypothetical protein